MLQKKEFLFFGASPVMGFVDPEHMTEPLAPMVEREEFERWSADQGWEYDIDPDNGMLFLNNVTGLDPRTDEHYNTRKVDVQIEPYMLDTDQGVRELYDLTELAEAGWVFSIGSDTAPQPPSPFEPALEPEGSTGGEYRLKDNEQLVWITVGDLSIRIARYPQGNGVTIDVYEKGKENDGHPLSGLSQTAES
jgi:hypothetical protein